MEVRYIPYKVEKFIQYCWKKSKLFDFDSNLDFSDKKYYCLSMFPYPSGKLHIGHIRNYTIGDIFANYKRLKGFKVLNPIGWDSFGLPAENAACNNNVTPSEWTYKNILVMKKQLKRLGFSFSWNREITTSRIDYYKWEQLFFIMLVKSGLVYRRDSYVNWDPVDMTVLANEQVVNGLGWRSNAIVEKKKIAQWYIKITDYAFELYYDLKLLYKKWPKKVLYMQKNWINLEKKYSFYLYFGKYYFLFNFFLKDLNLFLCINTVSSFNLHYFLKMEKFFIRHPVLNSKILFNFKDYSKINISSNDDFIFNFSKVLNLNVYSFYYYFLLKYIKKNFVFRLVLNILFEDFYLKKVYNYSLKDWCISRQRNWGAPIPILFCKSCGILPEKLNNLPIKPFGNFYFSKANFYNRRNPVIACYKCNNSAIRENDTFDTFIESSWYYLRYINSGIKKSILKKWLPVDQYVGGIEHATMHLIYSRFFFKVFFDFNIVHCVEPFDNLLTQGMVLFGGSKMSKSKGNIVDQNSLVAHYGADSLRLFIIFCAPPEQSFEWDINGIKGCKRFLDNIWTFIINFNNEEKKTIYNKNYYSKDFFLIDEFNLLLKKIYHNLYKLKSFNVVISLLMKMFNMINKLNLETNKYNFFFIKTVIESILILLSPICPHITNYIWVFILKKKCFIFYEKMPSFIKKEEQFFYDLSVFINNKFKKKIRFFKQSCKDVIITYILKDSDIKFIIKDFNIKNIIYKEKKMVNIVLDKGEKL